MEKRHKIDLRPYEVEQDGKKDSFEVVPSLIGIMFNPDLGLGAREILRQDELGQKLERAGNEILLTGEDYSRLLRAVERFGEPGRSGSLYGSYSRNSIPLIKRVLEAEEVEVEVKEASDAKS